MNIQDIIDSEVDREDGIPGVMIDGTFWFWDGEIDTESIASRHSSYAIAKILRNTGVMLTLASMIVFVVGLLSTDPLVILKFGYWLTPHGELVAFWLSILFACFTFYKHQSIVGEELSIPVSKHGAPERTSVPSLGAVSQREGMFELLTPDAMATVEEAFDLAKQSGHQSVISLHLFAAATKQLDVRLLFARLGISASSIIDPLRRRMAALPKGETKFGKEAIDLIGNSFYLAAVDHSPHVAALDIAAACFAQDAFLQEVLFAEGIDFMAFTNAVVWLRIQDRMSRQYKALRSASILKPTDNMDRAYTAIATPFLDSVSTDLTVDAVYGRLDLCVAREAEIASVMRIIEGGRQSVVLVGQPGVGKAAIIDGIAWMMVEERVPEILQDKRLLKLNVAQIVSSQGGNGAEERLLFALQEVAMSGNVVLVIENVHELVGVGGSIDLSSILASELEKGYTFAIMTTTPSGYTEKIERSVLHGALQKVEVDEPDQNAAIHMLESQLGWIENKNHVAFTYQAVAACVELAARYLHDNVLPTSALQIAKDTALVAGKKSKKRSIIWVTREDVAEQVSLRSKVPVTSVSEDEGHKLLQLEEHLHERVIGQDQAVKAISSALRRARTQLRSGKRPIANFLFLGPTGVGKTELAKTTSEVYFGNENAMVRFDMSEYQEQSSLSRLIGANGQAGQLTEAIRKSPFSLVLLDELEKAHPDILNVFLSVMDDGRLTDGMGRTIDFTNVILIATSNAGTQFIQDEVAKGSSMDLIKTSLMESELRKFYRPEFLNRFDDVIVFAPLTIDDVAAIAYLMIAKIEERLKTKGISLTIDDEAIHELAAQGFDAKFGARPLRRVLQDKLENAIADRILQGDVGRRDTIIYHKGGEVEVQKAKAL